MGCPDDRCGFTLDPVRLFGDWDGDVEEFYEKYGVTTCYRDAWRDGRCVWHAKMDGKPLADLKAARADGPERLDGVYLVDAEISDTLSFWACTLVFADFTNADLRKADFTNADLRKADFTNADLRKADFTDANLAHAGFTGADLRDADFTNANLYKTEFTDAGPQFTDFTNAKLYEADFTDAGLLDADFTDADLGNADFTDASLGNADFTNARLGDADFTNAHLLGADFTDADLENADFTNADLRAADVTDAFGGADFTDADLENADFTDTDLENANFTGAGLENANFTGAGLENANFTDADLENANFTNADPRNADFTDATLEDADLTHSILHDALLVRADCRGTTFTSALLYEVVFSDTRINSRTSFYDPEVSRPACVYEEDSLKAEDVPDDTHPLKAAEWVYRRLETLHEENALSEEAREFHISKEEARREHQREKGEYARYAVSTLQWHLSRHGESVRQVFISAAVLILACGAFYPFVGGFESDSSGTTYRFWELSFESLNGVPLPYVSLLVDGPLDFAGLLLQSLYFSVITFTTIGYGDLYPTGPGSKILVGFESLSGAILIALFVFVLGRRVAR